MTFGLNFLNMNTMMNQMSMLGMSGFGGYSAGINPFGSVFSFYGSGSSCCGTPNYSTRTCGNNNPWASGLGMMLGYAGVMLGTPLLIKGAISGFNAIKKSTNGYKQTEVNNSIESIDAQIAAERKKLAEKNATITKYDEINTKLTTKQNELKNTLEPDLKRKEDDYTEKDKNYKKATEAREAAEAALAALDPADADYVNKKAEAETLVATKKAEEAAAQKEAEEAEKAKTEAQKSVNDANAEIKKLEEELAAANKAKATEAELEAINAKIAELEAQKKEKQKALDSLKLDELDGTRLGRTTADDFKKVYDLENNQYGTKDGKDYNAGDIKKADMKYLLSEYATLSDGDKKDNIRNYVLSNWDNFDSKIREDFKSAKEIMERDQKKKTQQA